MTWPVLHAAAGQQGAADLRPVVAAGVLVDARRAAELAPGDHRHVVEHAARFQVVDQGAERLVELGAVVAHQVEVLAVAVPAAVGQRHAADAGLDQPPGHQQLVVDGRGAVVLEVVRLAVAVASRTFSLSFDRSRASSSRLEVSTPKARLGEGVGSRG